MQPQQLAQAMWSAPPEVAAIRSVDAIQIGNGKRGPVTTKIANAYFGLVQGKAEDKRGWLDYVDMIAPRVAVAG